MTPLCPLCGATMPAPYADGRPRRYCSRPCLREAQRLWWQLVNRTHRRGWLLSPTGWLPEAERLAALHQVETEIDQLEQRLGLGKERVP